MKVSGDKVGGEFHAKDETNSVKFDIAVKFNAQIEVQAAEAEPTEADAVAAKKSAAAIAYLAFQDAIAKGDKARILAAAPAEFVSQINGPDFAKMLTMIQAMQTKELVVRKAVEKDGAATLWVTGKSSEGRSRRVRSR